MNCVYRKNSMIVFVSSTTYFYGSTERSIELTRSTTTPCSWYHCETSATIRGERNEKKGLTSTTTSTTSSFTPLTSCTILRVRRTTSNSRASDFRIQIPFGMIGHDGHLLRQAHRESL